MHITLEADYAVRIVENLAHSDKIQDAKSISKETNVSIKFALKILRNLVEKGIVKSYKGSKGGYMLNRPANTISLKEVIECVEGPYFFSRCLKEEYSCDHVHCNCKFYKVYDEITSLVREKLESVTFDSKCDKCKKRSNT